MILALARLSSELDSTWNQILSGSSVPNYEADIEQVLHLATPQDIGPISTPSPTKSSSLASQYHGRSGRTGGRVEQRHGIHCNYCIVTATLKLIVVQSKRITTKTTSRCHCSTAYH